MKEVEKKPARAGVAGTAAIWILFVILGLITPVKKPYKTIQIRLDAPQSVAKAKEAAAPKTESRAETTTPTAPAAPTPQNKPALAAETAPAVTTPPTAKTIPVPQKAAPAKAAETPKKPAPAKTQTPPKQTVKPEPTPPKPASQTKPAPAKPSTKPAPTPKPTPAPKTTPVQQTLTKSVEELMAEQQASAKKSAAPVDWDAMFDDAEAATSTQTAPHSNPAAAVAKVDALQGSSAHVAATSDSAGAAASSSSSSRTSTAASSATSAALGAIAQATYSAASGNGVSATSTVKTGSTSDGKVALQMADGSTRTLLEPSEPRITLSAAAAALIDSTKQVTITFLVTANGTVPVSGVKISPASILPVLVQTEISQQISRWRFNSASSEGRATFEYKIVKQ